ncbi:MAG TPA: RNB domain-containing ribonuclease [Mycobacteriales bacterium]|nr:RNB domain-containing ribonuclease [Mycobacteriales bacterium]
MPTRRLTVQAPLRFDAVRAELDVPAEFPAEVLAEAERAAAAPVLPAYDATDLPLVTVDPPGSRDLDQAVHLAARPGGGFRVSYAIADVAAFVRPGGAVDAEARRRTQTLYSPDLRTALHPPALGEGAASLLPDQIRPAVLWRIDLDPAGEVAAVDVRRALVRSRAQLDYPGLQAAVDAGTAPEPVALLPRVGELRTALARARHATELEVPEQEVLPAEGGGWTVQFRRQLPVERWNAQVSLLTGACAARLMLDAGVGLLRTLPAPRPEDVAALRRLAPALGVDWPAASEPGDVISALDGATPGQAAFLEHAAVLLRGAAYTPVDGAPPADPRHHGVGLPYAHVTAPIRRLVDRFGSEVCVAVGAGAAVPDWARAALPELPALMTAGGRLAGSLERAVVDATEAWLLAGQEGRDFPAVVLDAGKDKGTVVLDAPAVRATCTGAGLPMGERIAARLEEADQARRVVRFTRAPGGRPGSGRVASGQ